MKALKVRAAGVTVIAQLHGRKGYGRLSRATDGGSRTVEGLRADLHTLPRAPCSTVIDGDVQLEAAHNTRCTVMIEGRVMADDHIAIGEWLFPSARVELEVGITEQVGGVGLRSDQGQG